MLFKRILSGALAALLFKGAEPFIYHFQGLTNPDVNQKRMHQLYNAELVSFVLFVFQVPHDCCVALPYGAQVCLQFVIVVFPVHTHYFQSRTCHWPI